MLINLADIDENNFIKKSGIIKKISYTFIYPKKECKWTKENEIFFSSIWDKRGEPISLYFKKQAEQPVPLKNDKTGIEKIGGNTAILSKYKNILFLRGVRSMDIKPDFIENMKTQHGLFFCFLNAEKTIKKSFIFNMFLNEFYLINIIEHDDYTYWAQQELDTFSLQFKFKRPKRYFENLDTIKDIFVYYNKDQNFSKIKQ